VIPYTERPTPGFLPSQPREQRPDARGLKSPGWPFKNCVSRDIIHSITTMEWEGESRMEIERRRYFSIDKTFYQTDDVNPANSSFSGETVRTIELENRKLELKTFISLHSDKANFYVKFTRQIFEGTELIKERTWKETIPREFH